MQALLLHARYLVFTAFLLPSACAVGPDFVAPEAPAVGDFGARFATQPGAPRLLQQDQIPGEWWQLFGSHQLNRLVALGLDRSPTLSAARSRLIAAVKNYEADSGEFWYPEASVGLGSTRQSISGVAFGSSGGFDFTLHNASIDVAYSITPFGAGIRYLEAVEAMVDYEAVQLEATRLTLAANIVTAALTEASLREQLAATTSIIEDESALLDLVEKQYNIGVIPRADLLTQQAAVAESRTQLPALNKALAQARNRLASLLGVMPHDVDKLPRVTLDALTMPEAIPVTLPSTLTRRRPDIRAAEALLHQASANVGVATASLYPSIALSAGYGKESTKFSELFDAGTTVWGVAAGLTQPLFQGGALRARKRAAEADYDRVAALYRHSVIDAFRDVADTLLALQHDSEQLGLQQRAETLTRERRELIRAQYRQGAASYLSLLDAQRRHQQARIALIKARVTLFNDTAALLHALGGGWDGQLQRQDNTDAAES